MTVKTTIKFSSDVGGALDASIEAVQIAAMRLHREATLQERLEKVIDDLRAVKRDVPGPRINQKR